MRILIVFILRVVFMLFTVPALGITAAAEYISANPDWVFWKQFNQPLIDRLPWAKYT